ncbi:hypothetical protein [Citreimonas salinaria]|uniref:Lipoprotein n=1 Tax=Citreimonas salinaria TaxID=321339 RepID=A0A1H3GHH9_9RHOB|nr:hypothetical protein [Citreimonas salinaria]SDY02832.1 hypothetical protein SAMN05444340_102359 [Citreimonas salinaria]
MGRTVAGLVVAAMVLGGCASLRESRVNPFNWFGRAEPVAVTTDATGAANPLIPRRRASFFRRDEPVAFAGQPVMRISDLAVERRPGGAIIRATGVAERLGPWDVRLVPLDQPVPAGELAFVLRAQLQPNPVGTELARTLTAAVTLSDQQLSGVSQIRVVGATNALAVRR